MTHSAHAQVLRLRLFLEGIEIPVIAASIQASPNSPIVATIQIPPLVEGTKFHPRTLVHLFFLDLYKSSPAIYSVGESTQSPDMSTRGLNAAEAEQRRLGQGQTNDAAVTAGATDEQNTEWRLLFGGELVGFTWTKNVLNRSIILQCEDWSNYWDYAFQSDNTDIFGPGLKAVFSGSATNLFTDFLESQSEVLTHIITSGRCNTFPNLKGLAAGLIRLLEAVGGSYYVYPQGDKNNPPKRIAGQNLFFSYNELRLHLTQMIGTYEKDPTSERMMRYQGYSGMFHRALGGQGGQVSIRKAVNAISRIIFYEMFPQPCPKYKPGGYGEISGIRRVKLKDHPTFGKLAGIANDAVRSVQDFIAGLEEFAVDVERSYGEQIRELASAQARGLSTLYRTLQRVRFQSKSAPSDAVGTLTVCVQKAGKALSLAQQMRGAATGNTQSAESKRAQLLSLLKELEQELSKIGDFEAPLTKRGDQYPAQLYQQIFRPDVWFIAPPRCNVFFPELYERFTYQRSFLQEPTRFLLKTNDEFFGEDFLFDRFYFAPQAGTVKGTRGSVAGIIGRELLDHERFTGILPVFEKMGEFNIFASRAEGRPGLKKIGLAQRSANFLYFRHRFNARRAQLTGKFNPYVAVGCPGLIIDRYVDRETIALHNELRRQQNVVEIPEESVLGTNFLGNLTQVVHQLSNPGATGVTDITLTFPRQHDETVEYLGAIPDDVRIKQRIEGADAVRSLDIAALEPPKLYSLGPNRGQITNVQLVSDQYRGKSLPAFFSGAKRNTEFRPVEVPIGVPITAADKGGNPSLSMLLGGEDVPGVFQAYRITEEIPRYRLEQVLLPAEEYIRPGWYGDVWTNSKVGQVWQELFSTGAITDPISVTDRGRNSSTLRSEESQQAATGSLNAEDATDPTATAPALIDLQEGASLQQAIEFLQLTYSYIRQSGVDVDEFIGAYTWRPIASLVDMFGTSDLAYDSTGQKVLQGFEGFHSRAIGPYQDLFGLVTSEIEDVLNIKRGSTAAQNIDVRKERREKVEQYVAALLFGNALLG